MSVVSHPTTFSLRQVDNLALSLVASWSADD